MLRRVVILGMVAAVVASLAAVVAVRGSTRDAEAQVRAYEMRIVCREAATSLFKGTFTGECPPGHVTYTLPEDYPLSLCASYYDALLRAVQPNGQCPPGTRVRIDLPSSVPYAVCYVWATSRLRVPVPYPNGACGSGAFPVTFPEGESGPEAADDSYQTLGNVDIDVPAGAGVLGNDTGDALTVATFDAASANGGTIAMNPDGSFTYTPPAGYTGDDTFNYEAEEGDGDTDAATVTIEVLSPRVWFVDAGAAGPGDGRRLTPFNDLQTLNNDGSDPDAPGDFIFLYEATTFYQPGIVLEDNQKIVGQEVDLGEILNAALTTTSSLQGPPPNNLPPFIDLPETNPTGDEPVVGDAPGDDGPALTMADSSTAAGFVVVAFDAEGVLADGVTDVTLDRMRIDGGLSSAGPGMPAIVANGSTLLIVNSGVFGGDVLPTSLEGGPGLVCNLSICDVLTSDISGGGQAVVIPGSAHALQGNAGGGLGADGGEAIAASGSVINVTDSTLTGGDASDGLLGELGASGTSLQGGASSSLAGDGGDGIGATGSEITVSGTEIVGGVGGAGSGVSGFGGDAINAAGVGLGNSSLAGITGPLEPSVVVSASTLTAGPGGDGIANHGGPGGDAIFGVGVRVSVSDNSVLTGGNSGVNDSSTSFGGLAGDGIDWRIGSLGAGSQISSGLLGLTGTAPVISVIDSVIAGGDGVAPAGPGLIGGNGGAGIIADNYAMIDSSARMLFVQDSTVIGGDGGENGTLTGFPRAGGGPGISVPDVPGGVMSDATLASALQGIPVSASVELIGSDVFGGSGGGNGGNGGNGAILEGGTGFVISNTGISGGDGADATTNANGGNGGISLSVPHGGDLTISAGASIQGGTGGDGATGADGLDGQGLIYFMTSGTPDPASFVIDIQNSTIPSGISISQTTTGSLCLNATGNTVGAGITLIQTSGTFNAQQADQAALDTANGNPGVTIVGTVNFGVACVT